MASTSSCIQSNTSKWNLSLSWTPCLVQKRTAPSPTQSLTHSPRAGAGRESEGHTLKKLMGWDNDSLTGTAKAVCRGEETRKQIHHYPWAVVQSSPEQGPITSSCHLGRQMPSCQMFLFFLFLPSPLNIPRMMSLKQLDLFWQWEKDGKCFQNPSFWTSI